MSHYKYAKQNVEDAWPELPFQEIGMELGQGVTMTLISPRLLISKVSVIICLFFVHDDFGTKESSQISCLR